MKYKAYIFDLDGTLVDSGSDLANATNLMRQHYGLETLPIPQIITYIGNGAQKLVERALAKTDLNIEEALGVFLDYYEKNILINTKFFPGVEDFLKKLNQAGAPAVVLTNKPQAMTDKLLQEMNATHYFKLIYGPEAYGKKPDATGLVECMKQLNVDAKDTLMIGDHTTDLNAATGAGTQSVFCTFGLGNMEGCNPDFIIESGEELFKFL